MNRFKGFKFISIIAISFAILFAAPSKGNAARTVSILGDSYSTFEGWMSSPDNWIWYAPNPINNTDVTDVNQKCCKFFIDENGYEL